MDQNRFDLEAAVASFPLPDGLVDATVNRSQIGQALNVSENTVTKYVTAGMPVLVEGGNGKEYQFQLSHCFAWRMWRDKEVQRARSEADRAAAQMSLLFRNHDEDDPNAEVLSAKDVLDESRADVERNKAAEMRGELVRASRVRALTEDMLIAFRTNAVTVVDFAEMEFGLTPEQVAKLQVRADAMLVQARADIEQLIGPLRGTVMPIRPGQQVQDAQ